MLQEIQTPTRTTYKAVMQTVAVFATVAGERVKVNFKRGSDQYGWWIVAPLQNPSQWYLCRRECMTNITRQIKLV